MDLDSNKKIIIQKRIERTIESLKKNNMQAYYVEGPGQAVEKLAELMNEGDTVTCGGSMTLFETGIIDHLRSGRYNFLDRYAPGLTGEELNDIYIKAFSSDVYVTSSNAITENGELYNVDGRCNRVAAMLFGPKSVIVVAGYNKIVRNIEEAVERVRRTAAPANCVRLSRKTPCVHTGKCEDCMSEDRICCGYVVMARQMVKDRVKVIIVGDEFGY